jgi:hypothetical protein
MTLTDIEQLGVADTIPAPTPYGACPCGMEYTEKEWAELTLVGYHKTVPCLEMRLCTSCDSSMSVEI